MLIRNSLFTFSVVTSLLALTACEREFSLMQQKVSDPTAKLDPVISEDPVSPNDPGATEDPVATEGVGTAPVEEGRLIVWGDEHVARSQQYKTPDISQFWSNALNYLTKGKGGKIGLLGLGQSAVYGFPSAAVFTGNLEPKLDPKFVVKDLTKADSFASVDAVVMLSYDAAIVPATLGAFVKGGKGLMVMVIGLPGSSECADMNKMMGELPFVYDCARTTLNLPGDHFLFNNTDISRIPFENGHFVLPRESVAPQS